MKINSILLFSIDMWNSLRINIIIFMLLISALNLYGQENEMIYALNRGVTTKEVSKNKPVLFGATEAYPNKSYIVIKDKRHGNYYIQLVVSGQFAYGHYFKYNGMVDDYYRYIKTDGMKDDIVLVNYNLSDLAKSNQYDEYINFKMINYRTSYALFLQF